MNTYRVARIRSSRTEKITEFGISCLSHVLRAMNNMKPTDIILLFLFPVRELLGYPFVYYINDNRRKFINALSIPTQIKPHAKHHSRAFPSIHLRKEVTSAYRYKNGMI